MKIKLLAILFLVFSQNAFSATWNNWEVFSVMSIIVEGDDYGTWFNVRTTPFPTASGCSDPGYMVLDASTTKGQAILATLISAQATGQKFHILTDGCDGTRPRLEGVWTLP